MAQTGVPFGQVTAVRDWLRIDAAIGKPPNEHPKRRVTGLACSRNEISGERLWGLFARRFGQAEDFFREHFVMNYCPLVFLESSGRNRTPDKLPAAERAALFALCDEHLRAVVRILRPDWLVGIGRFASRQAEAVTALRVVRILHPSPANPAANVDWAGTVMAQLRGYGVWP
jgi:single-strand selective monofunctional uracil DNA glycosylase